MKNFINKKNFLYLQTIIICSFFLAACFSSWTGGMGTFSINLGGTESRAVSRLLDKETISTLEHTIRLHNGPGPDQSGNFSGNQTVYFSVVPGLWDITIEARSDGVLIAVGFARVEVKSGQNGKVSIKMALVDDDTGDDEPGDYDPGDGDPGDNDPGDNAPIVMVTTEEDSGEGSLRWAIVNVPDGGIIRIDDNVWKTIQLESRLEISKNLTIEGNGITLLSVMVADSTSQIMLINSGLEVKISRVNFSAGNTASNGSDARGGAIYNNGGNLSLESCIFDGNQALGVNGFGGAIYNSGELTLRGCTFYNNKSEGSAGAIFNAAGRLTLTGNLFYGNTGGSYPVVYAAVGSSIAIWGYNVVDAAYGTGTGQCGWTGGGEEHGDTTFGDLAITGNPFNTDLSLTYIPVHPALKLVPQSLTTGQSLFPTVDFYGKTRDSWPQAPGAVAME